MTGLLRVEFTRFFARRAIVVLLMLGLLVTAALAFKTAWDTRPADAEEIATAQADAELAAKDPSNLATVNECARDPQAMIGPDATVADCRERLLPSAESLLERQPLNLPQALDDEGGRLAAFLVGLLVIAGATFVGADFASRSITNQLIFEPRRIRVWLTKAVTVALAGAGFMLVALSAYWLSLLLVADARELAVPDAHLSIVGWHVVRAVALAAGAAAGAFALTTLFRHTVAALALLFAYAAGSEVLVALLPVQGMARWTIGNNVFGWLKPDFRYVDAGGECAPYQECNPVHTLTHLESGWFLLALLVVACVAGLVSFTRRDV